MAYRHADFLSTADEPTNRVRCPIHGFIRFSENERAIIDHRLFRRLRYIRQLALTELVYPGATHSRFEHSLGVMDIASRSYDALATKHGDLMEAKFREVEGFQAKPLAVARQALRLAALLHDTGHASFSHAAESVVHKDSDHEQLSIAIIHEPDLMGTLLTAKFGDVVVSTTARIIGKGHDLAPQLQILSDIVSGQLDADRTDYLLRDSYHCGVDYGKFDYIRMIDCLEVNVSDLGALELGLGRDGLHTFEALILARYQMTVQVYMHRLRRIYDEYLLRYHRALAQTEPFTIDSVLANNDITMMKRIMDDAKEPGAGERHTYAKRIVDRNHHRLVHETGVNANAMDVKRSVSLCDWLGRQFKSSDFVHDKARASIHKLFTRDDHDDEGLVQLPLIIGKGRSTPVGYESQILGKIPKDFLCARIFADTPASETLSRDTIEKAASSRWLEKGGN